MKFRCRVMSCWARRVSLLYFLFPVMFIFYIFFNDGVIFRSENCMQNDLDYLIHLKKDSLESAIEKIRLFGYTVQDIMQEAQKTTREKKDDRLNNVVSDQQARELYPSNFREPSIEFETTRRAIENGVRELSYFVSDTLKHNTRSVQDSLDLVAYHRRLILNHLTRLADMDGTLEWRIKEEQLLSQIVQQRITDLQNPADCRSAKKIACSLRLGCGFGCQMHHVVYCMIMGYGTNRTVVFDWSSYWPYFKSNWESVFQPISATCGPATLQNTTHASWPGHKNTQVLHLPRANLLRSPPDFLPQAIPDELAQRLIRIHGNPFAWWLGQFLKYLFRLQPSLKTIIDSEATTRMEFQSPIVGVHVRRTDKLRSEAQLHLVEEYMGHVEDYYQQFSMKSPVNVRRVYLASDEPKVFQEAITKYPDYIFLFDSNDSRKKGTPKALQRIIMDIYFLSRTDFLVCTFSSNVCRLAYAIMQTLHADASNNFRSLDDTYYFDGQRDNYYEVIYPHNATTLEEIELEVGDRLVVLGNHWNGFSKGINQRTRQTGLFPSIKVRNKIKVVKFP